MPSPDGGTRVVPDFSRTFLGDPVLSTGMAVPSTAESTFPQLAHRLWTSVGRAAGGATSGRRHPGKAKGPRKYELQGPFC